MLMLNTISFVVNIPLNYQKNIHHLLFDQPIHPLLVVLPLLLCVAFKVLLSLNNHLGNPFNIQLFVQ